ncbi:MAG: hypothetical protein CM1200mP41_35070 [Gammaproteobacteria bacterium]|nr:MAG: hypothetical protein CM1200mP41_35070 [Gammaproteobacteria bacterium]
MDWCGSVGGGGWISGTLPFRRIWGVGPVGEKTLQAAGFKTLGD